MNTAIRWGLLMACLVTVTTLTMIAGCGGGGDAIGPGGVKGWVHISDDGTTAIITGSRVPPDGYSPLQGANVYILGHPELSCLTDENGYYDINGIEPGTHTIVVTWDSHEVRFRVPVRSCRYTIGGGHSQGGGGFF